MASEDTPMNDALGGAALFSEDEQRVLKLFDRLQELQLQIALVKARQSHSPSANRGETERDIKAAQDRFLETRASYFQRNYVVESVLSANPTLNAVHNAISASPIERDLEASIKERDAGAAEVAKQSTELHDVLDRLTRAETESIATSRRNVELAAEVVRLAEEVGQSDKAPPGDAEAADQIARLEAEMKVSRRRWRIMKGAASAVVVGSGVDWARDPVLRDIVLDPE